MKNAYRTAGIFFVLAAFCTVCLAQPSVPTLGNSPSYDVIVTQTTPLLSFFNATGEGTLTYDMELDTSHDFSGPDKISYTKIPQGNIYVPVKNARVTSKLVEKETPLKDGVRYYWRVRAVDSKGRPGPWASTRFYVDTKSDDAFMGLVRTPAKAIMASSGSALKNITDYSDEGQSTYWQAVPPGLKTQWVIFDLGKRMPVTRVWMLSNPGMNGDNWLKDFRWLTSDDGNTWTPVPGSEVRNNDTFRNIQNFKPAWGRYFKLEISGWYGYAPQLNCVILYSPGKPAIPACPEGPYVLCVGNQLNGFTFSPLAAKIRSLPLGLETLTVPHHEVSLDMVNKLKHPPVAIVLSGNNADYNREPMFEFNGEFELIRECRIPIYGICCGHQMTTMAYGFTNVRSMGWSDITSLRPPADRTKIYVVNQTVQFFKGMPNPFTAPEVHGCEVANLPENYVVTAKSSYVQCLMRTDKILYTSQFHPEIASETNQALSYLESFLKMAKNRASNGD